MRPTAFLATLSAALLASQLAFAQDAKPAAPAPAPAGDSAEDLAKKLSNPIANLISLPLQGNYNHGFASGDGDQYYLNIQPVIPFSISKDWNVISRTIVPIYSQDNVIPGERSQFGFGPTTQSLFFSPKAPTSNGIVWGVGPVGLLPTATDGISSNQWGLGLTGVVLKQSGPWTVGGLANHVWSVTGNERSGDISSTYLQPFVSYTTKKATSFGLNTESSYDWANEEWSVPINLTVSQLLRLGKQPVQIGAGVRYWAASPSYGPQDWGARVNLTFLFPK